MKTRLLRKLRQEAKEVFNGTFTDGHFVFTMILKGGFCYGIACKSGEQMVSLLRHTQRNYILYRVSVIRHGAGTKVMFRQK